jgi:hypothetical protein
MKTAKAKIYEKVGVHQNDAQIIDLGEALATKRLEANDLAALRSVKASAFRATDEYVAWKEEDADISAKINVLDADIDLLAQQIDTREKVVDVEIREEMDGGRSSVAVVRVDTGQVIRTRAMTLNEMAEYRQGTLPLEGGDGAAPDTERETERETDPPPAGPDGEELEDGAQKLVKVSKRGGRKAAADTADDTHH